MVIKKTLIELRRIYYLKRKTQNGYVTLSGLNFDSTGNK